MPTRRCVSVSPVQVSSGLCGFPVCLCLTAVVNCVCVCVWRSEADSEERPQSGSGSGSGSQQQDRGPGVTDVLIPDQQLSGWIGSQKVTVPDDETHTHTLTHAHTAFFRF